jgi:hypothetical protein
MQESQKKFKKHKLSILKTLCSDGEISIIMSDLSQHDDTRWNELIMKENSNMMINVDESSTHWTIRFADSKEKKTRQ